MRKIQADTIAIEPPDNEAVLASLNKVLANEEFARSPRIVEFFRFIVVETIEGRSEYIKAYTIALAAFGRDEAFDPQLDPVVRVQAVRLRRMLKQYYLTDGKNDPVVIELPRGSYVPTFARQAAANSGDATEATAPSYFGPSIVVLPFANLSSDPDQDIFADGVTEEIITRLAKYKELYVIARHTASLYGGLSLSVPKIAGELGVRYVMEGSIKRSSNVIRVTARLVSGDTGSDIWNDTYDRELNVDNLLNLQDEIANKIVATIAQPYGVIVRKEMAVAKNNKPSSLSSYKALLGYYAYYQRLSAQSNTSAVKDLEVATDTNPEHAEIWGALACLKADQYLMSFVGKSVAEETLHAAISAAKQAISLDPDSATCQHGWIWSHFAAGDINACHEIADHAIQSNPNNTLLLGDWGFALACSGSWEEGVALVDKAIALNPAAPLIYYLANVLDLYRRGEYSQSLGLANKIHDDDIFWISVFRAINAVHIDDQDTVSKSVSKLLSIYPDIANEFDTECRKWSLEESFISSMSEGLRAAGINIVRA